MRKRSRRKLTRLRVPHEPALTPNARWSMDFMRDTLATGRVSRLFNVVDDCTREPLAMDVYTSFPGSAVAAALMRLVHARGRPQRTTLPCSTNADSERIVLCPSFAVARLTNRATIASWIASLEQMADTSRALQCHIVSWLSIGVPAKAVCRACVNSWQWISRVSRYGAEGLRRMLANAIVRSYS